MNFDDFVTSHINKGYDLDIAYGAQCWDGYAEYCRWLGIPYAHCTATGGAADIWTQRATNGVLNYFDVVATPKNGDVCVWSSSYGGGYGHVAMYYNGKIFGQNQGGIAYPTGGACFNLIAHPMPDLGFLRPKILAASQLSWIIPENTRPLTMAEMQNNAKCVWGYLHSKGWSLNAVCGMLGNMQSESTINPNRWETDTMYPQPVQTRGFGLIQWTPWTIMTEYLSGSPISEYGNKECAYLEAERHMAPGQVWIDRGYGLSYEQFAVSTRDSGDLAIIYLANRERPLDPNQPIRAEQARYWYNYLKNWTPVVPEGAGSVSTPVFKEQLYMSIINGIVTKVWKENVRVS